HTVLIVILFSPDLFIVFRPFFFFQAEDGIRDFHVTGVQTCALPIFIVISASTVPNPSGKSAVYTAAKSAQENMVLSLAAELKERSEERRVGKEWSGMWWPLCSSQHAYSACYGSAI